MSFNQVIKWDGAGYYAAQQQGPNTVAYYPVNGRNENERSQDARRSGLGTPSYKGRPPEGATLLPNSTAKPFDDGPEEST